MLLVRLQVNCRLLAIKIWGSQKLYRFLTVQLASAMFKGQLTTSLIWSFLNRVCGLWL